jgi:hypothetical protein
MLGSRIEFVPYPSLAASCTAASPGGCAAPCVPPFRTPLAGLFPPPATLLDGTAEHTKAQVDVPAVRRVPAADRRTAVAGVEKPATAPVHPARARYRPRRIRKLASEISTVPVLTPLPDIPVYVIQPPRVRFLQPDRMRGTTLVNLPPSVVRELALIISKRIRSRGSSPTGILPFRFRGQAVDSPGSLLGRQIG